MTILAMSCLVNIRLDSFASWRADSADEPTARRCCCSMLHMSARPKNMLPGPKKIYHKCIKTVVVLSAWRWWLCDESDSPTQVALCSNLSLLPLTPQTPGNPPAPPPPPPPPLNPEMLDNPPLFLFTFQPPNYPHLFARNDCSRKQSWAVTLVRTVRAGWLRPTVRHRRLGVYSAAQEASRRASHTASRGASLRNTRWCSCRRAAVLREFPAPCEEILLDPKI